MARWAKALANKSNNPGAHTGREQTSESFFLTSSVCTMAYMWKSEDNIQDSVLFFLWVQEWNSGFQGWKQVLLLLSCLLSFYHKSS